jgi:DNA-binding NtrC family response regulator
MKQLLFPSNPILLVDDEVEMLRSFKLALRSNGINNVALCQDPRDVMALLLKREAEVILLDLTMPFISGDELLPMITGEFPEIPVIIITGINEVDTAVQCMKDGAFDYMVKPVEKNRLVSGVSRAIEIRELQYENRLLKERILFGSLESPEAFSEIVTSNRSMRSLFNYIESVAKSPQPVLITGETGVGKELMAKAVHTLSLRHGHFVTVNAAGIDDNIFSDTLFGHNKGAFTGADGMRKGLVEKASGGTLLLDEIGDLSADSQIKLLRLLQEREYLPLGSDLLKISDARIIVTTNHDLQALQESGRFRKDLYYRLRTHHLHIPPLRERLDDLPLLVDHFLEKAARSLGKKKPSPPVELITLLSNYHFSGNIRELETMIYDAVSSHKSKKLSMGRFQTHIKQERSVAGAASEQFTPGHDSRFVCSEPLPTLEQSNRLLIAEAMKRSGGNQSMAARLLGISRQRLGRHLKATQLRD